MCKNHDKENREISLSEIAESITATSKMYNSYLRLISNNYSEITASLIEPLNRLNDYYNNTYLRNIDYISTFLNQIQPDLSGLNALKDYAKQVEAISTIIKNSLNEMDLDRNDDVNSPDDDFVSIDKDSVKEVEIPENLVLPIGNRRLKMSTATFLTIIGLIINIISFLATASFDDEAKQLDLLRQQNNILYEILQSVDASSSSEADYINDLKENTYLMPDLTPSDYQQSPETEQKPDDNIPSP